MALISEPALPIHQAVTNPFTTNQGDSAMPDTTGPAFPLVNPVNGFQDSGMTQRMWLIAHAPPPPESWLRAQVDDEQSSRRRITPTELDVRWRIRWADTVLRLNSR